MSTIQSVQTNSYLVPLEVVLSDSIHGVIPHFELVIWKIMDSDGVEGIGYTYAVNSGAAAFHALIEGYLAPAIIGKDPEYSESIWTSQAKGWFPRVISLVRRMVDETTICLAERSLIVDVNPQLTIRGD